MVHRIVDSPDVTRAKRQAFRLLKREPVRQAGLRGQGQFHGPFQQILQCSYQLVVPAHCYAQEA